jgi:hypothetical protein
MRATLRVLALGVVVLATLAGTYGTLLLIAEDSEDGAPHEVGRYLVVSGVVGWLLALAILGVRRRLKSRIPQ